MTDPIIKKLFLLVLTTASIPLFAQDQGLEQFTKNPKDTTINYPLAMGTPRTKYHVVFCFVPFSEHLF